jgi:NAD-dependent SIR2 family protein deacetylase
MEQKLEALSPEDIARVEAQRKWVREHYPPESEEKYQTLEGKLVLLDAILKNKWIEPSEIVKLQCLGVTFGDALAQKLGLKWVAVEDEYGRDPALIVEGTSIITFPLTSISKRIENGEEVDVFNLFENACSKINELKQQLV